MLEFATGGFLLQGIVLTGCWSANPHLHLLLELRAVFSAKRLSLQTTVLMILPLTEALVLTLVSMTVKINTTSTSHNHNTNHNDSHNDNDQNSNNNEIAFTMIMPMLMTTMEQH